jgi:hypothetical protein
LQVSLPWRKLSGIYSNVTKELYLIGKCRKLSKPGLGQGLTGFYCCHFVLPGWKDKNPMPPKAAGESSGVKPEMGIMPLHRKCTTLFLSLPHSGILLSQFLQETEKKKRKSFRSSKSCQIRKRPLIIVRWSISAIYCFLLKYP